MNALSKLARCAIYTRKSTDHNLDLEFNSLDAQREACEAYIKSQAHEGWRLVPAFYDDGGISRMACTVRSSALMVPFSLSMSRHRRLTSLRAK